MILDVMLTTGVDFVGPEAPETPADFDQVFQSTSGDDTFNADLLTVNDGDTLDGAEGTDSLTMLVNQNVTDKFKSSNIENVTVNALGAINVDMKNIKGVETFSTDSSTGALTLNNSTENFAIAFSGSNTNNITVNGTSLSATDDKLTLKLTDAASSTVDMDAGYESMEIISDGTSNTLTQVTAVGANSATLSGTAELTLADNALTGVDAYTITNTGVIKFGTVTTKDVKTLNASSNTSGVTSTNTETTTSATAVAGMAAAASEIQLDAASGASVLLGSGVDNLYLTDQAVTGKSNTIKLGAGNDKLFYANAASNGNSYIFGEAGDDGCIRLCREAT